MPRDYKNTTRRRKRKPSPGWVWMLAGLTVGLFVALLVFLHQRYPAPEVRLARPAPQAHPHRPRSPVEEPAARLRPKDLGAKAGTGAITKPKFDFYTILPEMEVMVPEQDIAGKVEHGVAHVKTPGTYVLQVGSFRRYDQADRLKAQLALLGLEANIQDVTVNGDETWHRVRLGPFHRLRKLNEAREVLKRHHVEALLLKLKG